jgi:hypothetical protein
MDLKEQVTTQGVMLGELHKERDELQSLYTQLQNVVKEFEVQLTAMQVGMAKTQEELAWFQNEHRNVSNASEQRGQEIERLFKQISDMQSYVDDAEEKMARHTHMAQRHHETVNELTAQLSLQRQQIETAVEREREKQAKTNQRLIAADKFGMMLMKQDLAASLSPTSAARANATVGLVPSSSTPGGPESPTELTPATPLGLPRVTNLSSPSVRGMSRPPSSSALTTPAPGQPPSHSRRPSFNSSQPTNTVVLGQASMADMVSAKKIGGMQRSPTSAAAANLSRSASSNVLRSPAVAASKPVTTPGLATSASSSTLAFAQSLAVPRSPKTIITGPSLSRSGSQSNVALVAAVASLAPPPVVITTDREAPPNQP